MDYGNGMLGPAEAERIARHQQAKVIRKMYSDGKQWVARRIAGKS